MSENLNVLRYVDGTLCWYRAGAGDEREAVAASDNVARLSALIGERRERVLFAAPGEDVRLVELEVTPAERKHLRASLPYMLEEAIAEDVDRLHVAQHHRGGLAYTAMVCRQACMAAWAEDLAELPPLPRWVPEPLLLPWRDDEWCLLLEDGRALLRHGEGAGTALERTLLPSLLDALLAERGAPETLVVYGGDEGADRALLPAALAERCQWRRGGFGTALWLDAGGDRPNLRQGAYAPQLPVARWWSHWRRVAAVFLAAFALQLLATGLEYRQLQAANLELRSAIEGRYREAYPRGAVVDPETQLRRQLEALKGDTRSSGFVALLARIGAAVTAQQGAVIESLNYSQRGDEMRLNIRAPGFAAVERVRASLADDGLRAALESSTNDGDAVRARLRVGGQG